MFLDCNTMRFLQIAADTVFTWYHSGALPSLCILSGETGDENNTAEETDADVVKRDVIEVSVLLV